MAPEFDPRPPAPACHPGAVPQEASEALKKEFKTIDRLLPFAVLELLAERQSGGAYVKGVFAVLQREGEPCGV